MRGDAKDVRRRQRNGVFELRAAIGGGQEGVLIEAPDSEATVFAYYDSVLRQEPWRVNLSVSYPIREISCLHLASPELSCSLVVQRSRSGKTLATFEWVRVKVTPR